MTLFKVGLGTKGVSGRSQIQNRVEKGQIEQGTYLNAHIHRAPVYVQLGEPQAWILVASAACVKCWGCQLLLCCARILNAGLRWSQCCQKLNPALSGPDRRDYRLTWILLLRLP